MGALSPTHWLIIIGVVVLLFGARKLPDTARSLGQSLRILKAETGELRHTDHDGPPAGSAAVAAEPPGDPDVVARTPPPVSPPPPGRRPSDPT